MDHVTKATSYATEVINGKILACKMVRLACERFIKDLANSDAPFYFDHVKGNAICQFVELFSHVKGEWSKKREKIRLESWQCFILVNVFGFRRKSDDTRRFRQSFAVVPRKNGKSLLSSAVGLWMLAADGEAGSEVYVGATTEKQAGEVFNPAQAMARANPQFLKHFGVQVNASSITILKNSSKFLQLIGNPGDGSNPHAAILDEIHEYKSDSLKNTMLTGMGARAQPLLWMITTAGSDFSGPCYNEILDHRKILEGVVEDDERFFIEYTIDAEDDWTDPEVLKKANPNYGISVKADYLIKQQADAVKSARTQGNFKTKHLNVWVNARQGFINTQSWYSNNVPIKTDDELSQYDCYVGIDLASKQDIAALTYLFKMSNDEYYTFTKCYLPEDVIDETGKDHYKQWSIEGKLIMSPGNMTDYQQIYDDLMEDKKKYKIREVAYDPSDANMFATAMASSGLSIFEFTQNAVNYSEPMKQTAALIDAGKLMHSESSNSPFTWQMSNVVANEDAKDRVFPRKEKPENKIDSAVCLFMAMSRAMMAKPAMRDHILFF